VWRERQAQAGLLADVHAMPEAPRGAFERALDPSKIIVDRGDRAVQPDPDLRQLQILQTLR
jgi:hypothetical protein